MENQQVWNKQFGSSTKEYCPIDGCNNIIIKDRHCNNNNHEQYGVYEIDHKVPLSKGGRDTLDNKWAICCECNREKSDSTSRSWR